MKKLLMIALVSLGSFSMIGCGKEATVIEPTTSDDSGMTADQQKQYEEYMKTGGSKRPGN